jgi:hypothetical protein
MSSRTRRTYVGNARADAQAPAVIVSNIRTENWGGRKVGHASNGRPVEFDFSLKHWFYTDGPATLIRNVIEA